MECEDPTCKEKDDHWHCPECGAVLEPEAVAVHDLE